MTFTIAELEMVDAMGVIKRKFEELLGEIPIHKVGSDQLTRARSYIGGLRDSISARDLDNVTGLGVLSRLFQ